MMNQRLTQRIVSKPLQMNKVIWEGWTAQNFVDELQPQLDMIMRGEAITAPFENRLDMFKWIRENQPYYKKDIPEMKEYFCRRYAL